MQHDFNIANQSFPATRTDLNNALQALASNSSGDAEPSTTFANQWWYETDTNTLKLRNEANNAWLSFATVDQTTGDWTLAHDVSITGTTTLAGASTTADITFGDNNKAIFGAGSDLQIYHSGSDSWIEDNGSGNLYIDTNGSGINISYNNSAENMASFTANGAVTLYHDNAEKLATTATGIDVTGTVNVTGADQFKANSSSSGDYVRMYGSSGTGKWDIYGNGANLRIGDNESLGVVQVDTGLNVLGNVGIGTTSPNATLTVSQSANNIFAVERTGTTGSGQFGINIETNSQATVSYDDGASLVFGTASNPSIHTGFIERLRIDSSGNLLVGTTNATGRIVSNTTGTYPVCCKKWWWHKRVFWLN